MFLAVSTSPHLLQLYKGVLQCCFAVKVQNFLWTTKPHQTFHHHGGAEHKD